MLSSPAADDASVKRVVLREIRKQVLTAAQWRFLENLAGLVMKDVPLSEFRSFLSRGIQEERPSRHDAAVAKTSALNIFDGLALEDAQWLMVGRFAAIIQRDAAFNFVLGIFREGPGVEAS